MDLAFTRRLLTAADHAYAITGNGPVPPRAMPKSPYGSGTVGYTSGPLGFVSGTDKINAGFVAAIPEGVLLVVRGTTPPQDADEQLVRDWINNAMLQPVSAHGFAGQMHSGFYASFFDLWLMGAFGRQARALIAERPADQPIYLAGHSKGGPVVRLIARRLRVDYPHRPIVVRSWGAPSVGDEAFAANYAGAELDDKRYEYLDDAVPHLPLQPTMLGALGLDPIALALLSALLADYTPVGELRYIDQHGVVGPDAPGLEGMRLLRLIHRIQAADFLGIANCHRTEAGMGYATAGYP